MALKAGEGEERAAVPCGHTLLALRAVACLNKGAGRMVSEMECEEGAERQRTGVSQAKCPCWWLACGSCGGSWRHCSCCVGRPRAAHHHLLVEIHHTSDVVARHR